eukprot:TRINITY_DN55_c0_g1_i1.p1 TRINITY_DN55_c0_g1~~TRINITY_DN55_c0_g1_i1.p1  ORF type:complete len:354 (+),score=104.89 TRINITY_DN55_c0_g1_i1:53-1114(+)
MPVAPKITSVLSQPRDAPTDNSDKVTFSFEYFPPKTDVGVKNLDNRLGKMRGMAPEFIDYTWGAGGSTSELTMELCTNAQNNHGYIANMHLTCTNMEMGKVEEALKKAKEAGITNIVALRGDPPVGVTEWKATDTGFKCALDLVKFIREKYGDYFCISVAGYPEGHPDKIPDYEEYLKAGKIPAEVYQAEMDYLKAKVDAGADMIISQMFYDADVFLNWVSDCRKAGITVPILPGLLPIQNFGGFKKMTGFCKTFISKEFAAEVEAVAPKEDLEGEAKTAAESAFKEFGIKHMTDMCKKLVDGGMKHLHFYTLNLDFATRKVLQNLGYVPQDYGEETIEKYVGEAKRHRGYIQ